MNLFQYTIQQFNTPKKENEFNEIFGDLINKIDVYKKQYQLTIKSYLEEREKELKNANEKYLKQKEIADEIYSKLILENPNDEYLKQYAEHKAEYDYISHEYYKTEEEIKIKYESFLDLYSKSLIIALYSLNESKLSDIINLASEVFKKDIKPSHFDNRDYLTSSITYLNLVIGIEIKSLEKYISFFKDVQFIRNKIVHSESKTEEAKVVKVIINKHPDSLKYENDSAFIRITSSKFLKDFISNLLSFHHHLIIEIDKTQDYQILKNELKYWLAPLDPNIFITKFKFQKVSPFENKILFTISSRKRKIPKFSCKIIMKKAETSTFDLMNQLKNDTITDFFELENKVNGLHLNNVFNEINIGKVNYKTTLLIYE